MTVLSTRSARATNTANILHINIGENILTGVEVDAECFMSCRYESLSFFLTLIEKGIEYFATRDMQLV